MQTIWQKSFKGKNDHSFAVEVVESHPGHYNIRITDAKFTDKLVQSKITISEEDINELYILIGEACLQIPHDINDLAPDSESRNRIKRLREISQKVKRYNFYINNELQSPIENDFVPPSDAEVFIYIADSEVAHLDAESITNSAGEFMEALGYELQSEDEPVYGSFWKRIQFVLNKHVSVDEVDRAISKGKKALELKHVELPTAEQTEKLANASKSIVESLEGFNEAVIRLGALLVLKRTVNGEPKLIIQQLSSELITILDKKPQLLKSPQTIYELITGDVQGEDDAADSTTRIGSAVIPEE